MEDSQPTSKHARNVSSTSQVSDEPQKRLRLDSTASVGRRYSAQEHAEMDTQVLAEKTVMTMYNSKYPLSDIDHFNMWSYNLLVAIVKNCSSLDNSYTSNEKAIEFCRKEEMAKLLWKAFQEKKFQAIRDLARLQVPRPTRIQVHTEPSREVVRKAWDTQYQGTCHEVLRNNIKKFKRENAFSNIVPIIQSSGTGKSRMVDEMAKLLFTIPINLRSSKETNVGHAYPDPDETIRRLFLLHSGAISSHRAEQWYLRVLSCLFEVIANEVPVIAKVKEIDNETALAALWRDHLLVGTNRQELYAKVGQAANDFSSFTPSHEEDDLEPSRKETKMSLINLIAVLNSRLKNEQETVLAIMYIDEADTMCEDLKIVDEEGKTLYDILCSTISYLFEHALVFVFLSTSSHSYQLAPSGSMARSSRARGAAPFFQAPITELAFDCHPQFPLDIKKPEALLADALYDIRFMARFGRPLFWCLLNGQGMEEGTLMKLARSKITKFDDYLTPWEPEKAASEERDIATLACIDIRIMLSYEPGRELSKKTQSTLVASHMRIAYSIPASREYVRSGYPSEPILAEAAAQQLREIRLHHSIPAILQTKMDNGLISRGERGEVVGRLLMTTAFDRAVERGLRNLSLSAMHVIYSRGCSVIDFFEELLEPKLAEEFLDSRPNNVTPGSEFDKPLRQMFKDARLRFTHFVKGSTKDMNTTHAMLAAYIRCMAVICTTNQYLVDFLLPVLLRVGPLGEWVMTAIMVQVKRRLKEGTLNKYSIEAEDIGFFPLPAKEAIDTRPYITLIMELGTQKGVATVKPEQCGSTYRRDWGSQSYKDGKTTRPSKQPPTGSEKKVVRNPSNRKQAPDLPNTPSRAKVVPQGKLKHPRSTHPRYSMYAYGCSSTVYRVIAPEEKDIYAFMLATRDMLSEHSRPDEDSLRLVRGFKPFWPGSKESFHWLKMDYSAPEESDEAADESFVIIGDVDEVFPGSEPNVSNDDDAEPYVDLAVPTEDPFQD